jgi:hypothetical protein
MKIKIRKKESRFIKTFYLLDFFDNTKKYIQNLGMRKYKGYKYCELFFTKEISPHTFINALLYTPEHINFIPKKRREYIIQRRNYEN